MESPFRSITKDIAMWRGKQGRHPPRHANPEDITEGKSTFLLQA